MRTVRAEDLSFSKRKQCQDALDRGLTHFELDPMVIEAAAAVKKRSRPPGFGTGEGFKQDWREVGEQRCFFRLAWEANFARYLQFLKDHGRIREWEHEPQRFDFPERAGNNSYLPDFRVTNNDDFHEWFEVKGHLTAGGRIKMKRFLKYFPAEKLTQVDAEQYRAIDRECRNLIEGWE